ncbi:hypothetical protein OG21DRAFT_1306308 [Imleria badia]|nr:hypothetical protein OG21DRAFT_1306308 [Imleria badia]
MATNDPMVDVATPQSPRNVSTATSGLIYVSKQPRRVQPHLRLYTQEREPTLPRGYFESRPGPLPSSNAFMAHLHRNGARTSRRVGRRGSEIHPGATDSVLRLCSCVDPCTSRCPPCGLPIAVDMLPWVMVTVWCWSR